MKNDIDINRLNYETFVTDYLDGNLSAVETACFIAFLENNPDIKEEIADLNDIALEVGKEVFTEKNILKKNPVVSVVGIGEDNYEDYFTAHYEGDLTEPQKNSLLQFLDENPRLGHEFGLHGKLRAQPQTDIVFPDKDSLKHKPGIRAIWYSSVAAAVLLFAASWFLFDRQPPALREVIVHVNQITSKKITTSLSSTTIAKIETEERKVPKIQLPDNDYSYGDLENIFVAYMENRSFNSQLIDVHDFARLVEKPKNIATPAPEEYGVELAAAEPINKKQQKSLIARVFNNQVAKMAQGLKFNGSKRKKSTDPTYIQVLDKSVLVFNTITGGETSTIKTYDRNGNLTSYRIKGQEVLLSRNFSGGVKNYISKDYLH